MTPQEKAQQIVDGFRSLAHSDWHPQIGFDLDQGRENAKQCALITVKEIICANPHSNPFNTEVHSTMDYWQKVHEEILKL